MKVKVVPIALLENADDLKSTAVIAISSKSETLLFLKEKFEKRGVPCLVLNFAEGFFPPDVKTEEEKARYVSYLRKKENELRSIGINTRLTPITREEAIQIISFFLDVKDKINCLVVACDEGRYRSQAVARFISRTFLDESYEPETFSRYTYDVLKKVYSELFASNEKRKGLTVGCEKELFKSN